MESNYRDGPTGHNKKIKITSIIECCVSGMGKSAMISECQTILKAIFNIPSEKKTIIYYVTEQMKRAHKYQNRYYSYLLYSYLVYNSLV